MPSGSICPTGHFCLAGSSQPSVCPLGTYQNQTAQFECIACPEGFVCDSSIEPVSTLEGRLCPSGSYCPAGTRHSLEYRCPPGADMSHKTVYCAFQCSSQGQACQ